jgi:hypothetical protein
VPLDDELAPACRHVCALVTECSLERRSECMGVTRRNEERVFRIPDQVRYAAGYRRHYRSGSCERFE